MHKMMKLADLKKLRVFVSLSLVIFSGVISYENCWAKDSNESELRKTLGTVELDPEKYSRVLTLSDIHGYYNELIKLLSSKTANLIQADATQKSGYKWISNNTLLVVIGDSIDKGPQSIEVLDLWIDLQNQAEKANSTLLHLLGNHEAEFLANPEASDTPDIRKALQTLTSTDHPRGKFLYSLPIAAKIGNWLFAHSGFYPDLTWNSFRNQASLLFNSKSYEDSLFLGKNSILEAKDWETTPSQQRGFANILDKYDFSGVVFGHQPGAFRMKNIIAMSSNRRMYKVDTGMAQPDSTHAGGILEFTKIPQLNTKNFPLEARVLEADGGSHAVPTQEPILEETTAASSHKMFCSHGSHCRGTF